MADYIEENGPVTPHRFKAAYKSLAKATQKVSMAKFQLRVKQR